MVKFDTRRWLYDLGNGERFRAEGRNYEVISSFDTEGIPYGFKIMNNTQRAAREGIVCAVDLYDRSRIRKFDRNFKVYAY